MDVKTTDPVIMDLLKWLKENLPPDVNEEDIFKKVRRVQKVFDTLISLSFEEFYKCAMNQHREQKDDSQASPPTTLEEIVDKKLEEMKEYLSLHEEKKLKTKKLDASTAKLELKRQHYKLVTSIRLDSCMDLIGRYNHLMSKK